MASPNRVPVLAVIGSGASLSTGTLEQLAEELGRRAVDAGFRIVCGGLGGVMEAACKGARSSEAYREGLTVGIIPSYDSGSAGESVDIVIPSGLGIARNLLVVSSADAVVALGGGSGTLSEIALAWQMGKPLIALAPGGGWAERLAGESVDSRRPDRIVRADSPAQAIDEALRLLPHRPA